MELKLGWILCLPTLETRYESLSEDIDMENSKKMVKFFAIIMILCMVTCACQHSKKEYGVFIGIDPENIADLYDYKTVVIDAEYFSKDQIEVLHRNGVEVYSYLNLGSLESFRSYYSEYKNIILGNYENWDDEFWVDVSEKNWQKHIYEQAQKLSEKNIDGFFLDNADVYFYYPSENIFYGLISAIRNIDSLEKKVIINGGDFFVKRAVLDEEDQRIRIDGVNQECVFTNIDFDNRKMILQDPETSAYYKEYIHHCKEKGLEIYLTEYGNNDEIKKQVDDLCRKNGYRYFISSGIDLDKAE